MKAEPSRKSALRRKKEEAIKGNTSKNLRKQLAQRAVEVAKRRSKKSKKERKGKDSDVKKLSQMLSKILTKGSDSKKKKKKRRLKNGVIENCSDSSSRSTDESEKMSSDEDLEALVKKKSRHHPGSVLALLTSHVREQLEQGATVDLSKDDGGVPRFSASSSYLSCERAAGARCDSGSFKRRWRSDQWGEGGDILQPSSETAVWPVPEGTERDVHLGLNLGSTPSRRHSACGRFARRTFHLPASVSSRWSLGNGKTYGTTSFGGEQCSRSFRFRSCRGCLPLASGYIIRAKVVAEVVEIGSEMEKEMGRTTTKEKERREKVAEASGKDTMLTRRSGRRTRTKPKKRSRGGFACCRPSG